MHAADVDGDGLDSAYDLNDNNIDQDDDGIFDVADFDQNGDSTGDNFISNDQDGDGIHDDADANDTYPSGSPSFITRKTLGSGGDFSGLDFVVDVDDSTSTTTEGGLFYVDSFVDLESSRVANAGKEHTYVVPTTTELSRFQTAFAFFESRNFVELDSIIGDMNSDGNTTGGDDYDYEIVQYVPTVAESPVEHDVYCLQEVFARAAGRGFFCINFAAENNHHVSAPHSEYDTNTDVESANVFWDMSARYLSVATAHRCGDASIVNACGGTTSACKLDTDGAGSLPFKISDQAHAINTFFHDWTTYIHDRNTANPADDIYSLQLHGCGTGSCPNSDPSSTTDFITFLSLGSEDNVVSTLVNSLKTTLEGIFSAATRIGAGVPQVISCNLLADDGDQTLCGSRNPQGRYINGASTEAEMCTDSSYTPTNTQLENSRFMHIEQSGTLRNPDLSSSQDDFDYRELIDGLGRRNTNSCLCAYLQQRKFDSKREYHGGSLKLLWSGGCRR